MTEAAAHRCSIKLLLKKKILIKKNTEKHQQGNPFFCTLQRYQSTSITGIFLCIFWEQETSKLQLITRKAVSFNNRHDLASLSFIFKVSVAYLEPSRISMMRLFAVIAEDY